VEEGNDIITGDGRIGAGDLGPRWERCSVVRNCGGEGCDVGVVEDVGHSDRVGCCSAVISEGAGGGLYWPVQVSIQWLWVGSSVGGEGAFMLFGGRFDSFCFTSKASVTVRSGLGASTFGRFSCSSFYRYEGD